MGWGVEVTVGVFEARENMPSIGRLEGVADALFDFDLVLDFEVDVVDL